jgi:three-Cys-motif partner protein
MTKCDEKYQWDQGLQILDPHSAAKHRIIQDYITDYIDILARPFHSRRLALTIVDAFAGAGRYLDKQTNELCDGSPLIFLRALPIAETIVNARRQLAMAGAPQFKVDPRYYFVDRNPTAISDLKATIRAEGFGHLIDNEKCKILQNTFNDSISKIISEIESKSSQQRVIFLLDQYAYKDVSLKKINEIFRRLPNAEVMLTFNVSSLISYLSEKEGSNLKHPLISRERKSISEHPRLL